MLPADFPRLIADIGGTYARFALEVARGEFRHVLSLPCTDYPDFFGAVNDYLARIPRHAILHAAVAIANPVDGDQVSMTNYHWKFSIEQMRVRLGFDTLLIVNDFTALAMALPKLGATDVKQIGGGGARRNQVIGLLGPGSGLGVSGLIPAGDGWISLGSEGGHTSFSPRDEREIAILQYAWKQYGHASFERLLSGSGLSVIYHALAEQTGVAAQNFDAPAITQHALDASDALCVDTLDMFCAMLGTAAANLAVTLGAKGGIYIGGGIVPRLGEWFERSRFRSRFEEKGRFSSYVAAIPTFLITSEHATFIGVSAILDAQLRSAGPASQILGQIRRAREELSPAELRVADYVLAHPREALNAPIIEIARASDVSQPTVIRFCRTLGCEGLSDFKLRLASGLTGTVPVTHVMVSGEDSALELGTKVLGNTAAAILQARNQLNRDALSRAIDLLLAAPRIECFASGPYGIVAQDAQMKFLRLGLACSAHIDPRLQVLSAQVVKEGEIVLIAGSQERAPELQEVADIARSRGAQVIVLATGLSSLARRADVVLMVEHGETAVAQLPMVTRILNLLMVDMLAVGIAMRKGDAASVSVQTSGAAEQTRLTAHGG